MKERVILVGTDPSVAELHLIMAREGLDVEVHGQLEGGIVGNTASVIIVDKLMERIESDILRGSFGPDFPRGLIEGEGLPLREQPRGALVFGKPRPYLKRKKGRS
jgi:hypothetical protein